MTLTSLPKPFSGGPGNGDDSEEEDDNEHDYRGGGSRSEKTLGTISGRPGSWRRNRTPAECPFDREEILQIWSRFDPIALYFQAQHNACLVTIKRRVRRTAGRIGLSPCFALKHAYLQSHLSFSISIRRFLRDLNSN